MTTTTSPFRFIVCIADDSGCGSHVSVRKSLEAAKKALAKLEPEIGRPLGIWDNVEFKWLVLPPRPRRGAHTLWTPLGVTHDQNGSLYQGNLYIGYVDVWHPGQPLRITWFDDNSKPGLSERLIGRYTISYNYN